MWKTVRSGHHSGTSGKGGVRVGTMEGGGWNPGPGIPGLGLSNVSEEFLQKKEKMWKKSRESQWGRFRFKLEFGKGRVPQG